MKKKIFFLFALGVFICLGQTSDANDGCATSTSVFNPLIKTKWTFFLEASETIRMDFNFDTEAGVRDDGCATIGFGVKIEGDLYITYMTYHDDYTGTIKISDTSAIHFTFDIDSSGKTATGESILESDGKYYGYYPLTGNISTEWVEISGTVKNDEGVSLCTMVLANGQYKFSCDPDGEYDLRVPLNDNGKITLFSFADGFAPYSHTMTPSESVINFDITMLPPNGDEPEMTVTNEISTAEKNPEWVKITGRVSLENGKPLCAILLANGQHMFTCDPVGEYDLEVPVGDNGQITIFSFVDGFKPFKQIVEVPF